MIVRDVTVFDLVGIVGFVGHNVRPDEKANEGAKRLRGGVSNALRTDRLQSMGRSSDVVMRHDGLDQMLVLLQTK